MKDFLIQCLKDLEPLTGIRQLYYLQSDLEDGERKKDVLIKGMLIACEKFPYIPDEAKKAIISSQMIEDQEYDALNSRTIWKWLNAFKQPYLNPKELQDKEVVFEPQSEETKKMIEDWHKDLQGLGKPLFKDEVIQADMKAIEREDKRKAEKPVSLSNHYKADPETIRMQELRAQYGRECRDLYTGRPIPGKPETFEEWITSKK